MGRGNGSRRFTARTRASKSPGDQWPPMRSPLEPLEPRLLLSVSMVKDVVAGSAGSYPENAVDIHGELVFGGRAVAGLWGSDGTSDGTVPLMQSVYVSDLTGLNGDAYFASDTTTDSTSGLWESNGAAAGTGKVFTGAVSQVAGGNGALFFLGNTPGAAQQVFRTDPASAAVTALVPAPQNQGFVRLITLGGQVLINTTGTPASPATLYALQADGSLLPLGQGSYYGTTDVQSPSEDAAVLGNTLYYFGVDRASGITALFRSDGTPGGTRMVFDFVTSTADAHNVAAVGGRLYFSLGGRVWSSDGTTGGTTPLATAAISGVPVAFGGAVFFVSTDPSNGTRLWNTDGTPAGTRVVSTLEAGSNLSNCFLTTFAGQLYVQAPTQFWSGDGTASGMLPVPGLTPGYGGNCFLGTSGGRLFVSASTPQYGTELWAFDAPAAVSGYVFNDTNNNAVRDPGEPGMPGVTIYLDANNNGRLDPGEAATTTDGDGNYAFYDLPSGDYTVREVLPAGYSLTAPAVLSGPLTLGSSQTARGPAFGNVLISSVTMDLSYFLTVTRNFGKPGTFAAGDVNGDGTVNLADLLLVTRNFGHALAGTSAALPAATSQVATASTILRARRR